MWRKHLPTLAKKPLYPVDIPLEITDKECNKSDTGFSEKVNLRAKFVQR